MVSLLWVSFMAQTMKARGKVSEIQSSPLLKGRPDQLYSEIGVHPLYGQVDYVGVEADGFIIGVAINPGPADAKLSDCMVNITEDMIASADTCLLDLVQADWTKSDFFLVIDSSKFTGIVTKADLNKQPIRVSVFELLSIYEQLLTDRLEVCLAGDDSWLQDLSESEVTRLESQFEREQRAGLELTLISCAALGLKVQVAWKRLEELHSFERADVDRITKLRNTVSHGKPLISSRSKVTQLSTDLKLINKLCSALS